MACKRNPQGGKLHARRNADFHSVNYQKRRLSSVMNIYKKKGFGFIKKENPEAPREE